MKVSISPSPSLGCISFAVLNGHQWITALKKLWNPFWDLEQPGSLVCALSTNATKGKTSLLNTEEKPPPYTTKTRCEAHSLYIAVFFKVNCQIQIPLESFFSDPSNIKNWIIISIFFFNQSYLHSFVSFFFAVCLFLKLFPLIHISLSFFSVLLSLISVLLNLI